MKQEKMRKKHRGLTILATILTAIVLVVILVARTYQVYYSKMNIVGQDGDDSATTQRVSKVSTDKDVSDKDVTNILLIGVDNDSLSGMDDLGNADGMIIVSINNSTKEVVMSSLMRDILIKLPDDSSRTKLTLSYHYGGTELLLDTIESNFGIPINNYVLVNYIGIVNIVDAMGGVTMNLSGDELFWMGPKIENVNTLVGQPKGANSVADMQPGDVTLNGVQTAAYLRIRYAGDGDFDRTARARNVIMSLLDKAKELKLSEFKDVANALLPCITTDMSSGKLMSFIMSAPKYLKYDMVSNRIPIDDTYSLEDVGQAGSCVVIDFEKNRDFLYNSIYKGIK